MFNDYALRAKDIPNSGITYMMDYAASNPDAIALAQGVPRFPTPEFIYDYVRQKAKEDPSVGMYPQKPLKDELKKYISRNMKEIYGFEPKNDELVITTGAIGGLFATMMAALDHEDEVILFEPGYPKHFVQAHLTDAKKVYVKFKKDNGWDVDFDQLEKSISNKTRMIVLANPNNPTGSILPRESIERLVKLALENEAILVADEAYEFIVYDDNEFFSPLMIEEARENIVLAKSFSKEYAMSGWRIGYIYANKKLAEKVNKIHAHYSIGPATIAIHAAIAALMDDRGKKAMDELKNIYRESRDVICKRLDNLPKLFSYKKPQAAFYVFARYQGFDINSFEFAKKLADEAGVVTVPGSSAGPSGEGYIRFTYSMKPNVINEAFDRLDEFAAQHNLK